MRNSPNAPPFMVRDTKKNNAKEGNPKKQERGSITMVVSKQYQSDLESILAKRHDNAWDYWTTPDRRLLKGSPFSTLDCAYMLQELGMDHTEPVLVETANLILDSWREDGRFKLSPQGAIPLSYH